MLVDEIRYVYPIAFRMEDVYGAENLDDLVDKQMQRHPAVSDNRLATVPRSQVYGITLPLSNNLSPKKK